MIVIVLTLLGILIGATTARRRKGNTYDILQYAVGYGIAFALLGFFATLIIEKILV